MPIKLKDAPPPASYNCISGACVDPGDGSGYYSTLVDCEASCVPASPPVPPLPPTSIGFGSCECCGGTKTECQTLLAEVGDRTPILYVSFIAAGCFLTGQTVELNWDAVNNWFQSNTTIGSCTTKFKFRIFCDGENLIFMVVEVDGVYDGRMFYIDVTSWNPFAGDYATGTDVLNCSDPIDFCIFGAGVTE